MLVHTTFTSHRSSARRPAAKALCCAVWITFSLASGYAHAAQSGAASAAVRVGGDIKPPVKVKDAKPVYPPIARERRSQGVVILEVTVGEDGKVKDTKIVKSMPLLDAAATEAVRKWVYKPTLVDGKAIAVIATIAVNFRLD